MSSMVERTGLEGRDGEKHGSYRLAESCVSWQINIVCDAEESWKPPRHVTTVPDLAGWDRFVAALKAGADEGQACEAAWGDGGQQ